MILSASSFRRWARRTALVALISGGTACLDFDYAADHFCDVAGRCDAGLIDPPDAGPDAGTAGGDPRMYVDLPTSGTTLTSPVTMRGWAVDLHGSSGTGIDRVRGVAYGAQVISLGGATYGGSRPDVANNFGSSRFDPSGFQLIAALPPGIWDVVLSARSTDNGKYDVERTVRFTVSP